MSLKPVVDRVPTKPNRWKVTHEDTTQEYVTVERADEPTVAGTSFNSALFKNLQGDIYTGVQYNTPTYSGTAMALDLPLSSYESGKIINIISPATFSSNPTLNVNGLGAKTVNALLTLNQKYTLVYNGSSFDVLMSGGMNKYYPITRGTAVSVTNENIIPTTGWRGIGDNEFVSGGIKIKASSTYVGTGGANYFPYYATDGSDSTYWMSENGGGTFTLDFGHSIKINKMKTFIKASSGNVGATISGSNDNSTWTTLLTFNNSQSQLTEITFTNTAEYRYYRISATLGSSYRLQIYQLQVSDYTSYTYTVDYPVNSYSDIWSINVIPDLGGWKSKLLVSGLGTAKDIDGALVGGEKYTLVYNGTSFIMTKADYSDIEQGTDDFKYVTPYLANILAKSITVSGILSQTGNSAVNVDFGSAIKALIIQLADHVTPPYIILKGQSSTITIETNATINSFSSVGVLQYVSRTKNVNYIALY